MIRVWFSILAGLFGLVGLGTLGMYEAHLAGFVIPLFDEVAAYSIATFGAVAVGLGMVCAQTVRRPELARVTAIPVGTALVGIAYVRYGALFYGDVLVGQGLSAPLVAEVVGFSLLGAFTASLVPGGVAPWAHFGTLMGEVGSLRPLLKAWLGVLVAVLFVAPLPFLAERPVQMLVLAQFLNVGVGLPLYVHTGGLTRGTSFAHVATWGPAAGAMVLAAAAQPGGAFGAWLLVGSVVIVACLVLDTIDSIRWLLGDRAPIAGGTRIPA